MIEVKHLTKFYGDHKAVDDISFTVRDGTVCGFLGPNGAGKSTTMNIMTGCLSATEGTITIGGYDIFENPIEAKNVSAICRNSRLCILRRRPENTCVLWLRQKRSPGRRSERRSTGSWRRHSSPPWQTG